MSLTKEQIETYHRDGCVIVPEFWTEREINAMRMELDRFVREGLIRNVATDGDGETPSDTKANLQIIPLREKSKLFRALPFSPKVVETVSAMIGDDWCRWLDQIFLKPARHGTGTGWHQDNAYFKISNPTAGVGMWTALHDASRSNGTFEMIPGSHKEVIEHQRDMGSNHHIQACGVDESKAVPVEVKAGGVVFFNYGIAHCTKANNTDKPRAGLAYHFLRRDHIDSTRAGSAVFVRGPEATGGLKEEGEVVEGTWEQEIQTVLDGESVATN